MILQPNFQSGIDHGQNDTQVEGKAPEIVLIDCE